MKYQFAIASSKGGCSKSQVSLHVCYSLANMGFDVVLADADSNQSCLNWAERGSENGFEIPFRVIDGINDDVPEDCDILWIDSQGNPDLDELSDLAASLDLIVIPCGIASAEVTATFRTIAEANLSEEQYSVLLTRTPPSNSPRGQNLHQEFTDAGHPIFDVMIQHRLCHIDADELGVTLHQLVGKAAKDGAKEYQKLAQEIIDRVSGDSD